MIEFLLYLILVTADGEKHVIVDSKWQSSVMCQAELKKLDAQLELLDTTHLESVKTGCHKRETTKVRI